jgi:RNA polymerase sigma-70 factor (ECF subfamily)
MSMATASARGAHDERQLEAAQRGDESAFSALVQPYRGELHAHCYRMLGSVHDAEDAMQEVLLRAWKALARFEGRSSLRSWLYTIATNTCLNAIARRPKRVLPIDYGPATDPHTGPGEPLVETVWIEPYPDREVGVEDGPYAPEARYERRESLELAFIAALQHLPPNQRAVLILREVLGFSAAEVADALETSVPSVNSALQRARKTVDDKLPKQSQQKTLRALGDERMTALVNDYMAAMMAGDVDRVVSMLAEDVAWSMPPLASWFGGSKKDVRDFLRLWPLSGAFEWQHRATMVNGQLATGAYTWHEDEQAYLPFALDVLTLEGDEIKEVTAFIMRLTPTEEREYYERFPDRPIEADRASVFTRFGLPERLER